MALYQEDDLPRLDTRFNTEGSFLIPRSVHPVPDEPGTTFGEFWRFEENIDDAFFRISISEERVFDLFFRLLDVFEGELSMWFRFHRFEDLKDTYFEWSNTVLLKSSLIPIWEHLLDYGGISVIIQNDLDVFDDHWGTEITLTRAKSIIAYPATAEERQFFNRVLDEFGLREKPEELTFLEESTFYSDNSDEAALASLQRFCYEMAVLDYDPD